MTMTATYSPEDNKLRLYSLTRLDAETYQRVKAAGFKWAPTQDLFFAPMWTPAREDLLIELCGEIGDEDKSLVERQEERAERFSDYRDNRLADADAAHAAVHRIADNIPLGQPILVGHHSEKHARRDAEKIDRGMRKAVQMWKTAEYWKSRAAGAIRHAKYKELPSVRARRIKTIEADKRKDERNKAHAEMCVRFWSGELKVRDKATGQSRILEVTHQNAVNFCNVYDHVSQCFTLAEYPRSSPASQYEGSMSLWSALGGSDGESHAVCTLAQAQDISLRCHRRVIENCNRWIEHYNNRIEYERAMLAESGGTVSDHTAPEVGGAVRCWGSPGHGRGWAYIKKVNQVSVTIMDKPPYGDRLIRMTMPFDKLQAVMSRAQVEEKRTAGLLAETEYKEGFYLLDAPVPPQPAPSQPAEDPGAKFEAMAKTLKNGGVQVVTAPQLFPTPPDLAARMVELANIRAGDSVLEPSAGTGAILLAIRKRHRSDATLTAVELNTRLAGILKSVTNTADHVHEGDFLELAPDLGKFDRVLMNPPFKNAEDIKHIMQALTMLKPGGRLVAICANGPRQSDALRPVVEDRGGTWEALPVDTFRESGTGVNTVLLVIDEPAAKLEPATVSPGAVIDESIAVGESGWLFGGEQ